MNVVLPENNGVKKKEIIIYAIIILICTVSVIVAFYVQFYARIDLKSLIGIEKADKVGEKTQEEEETLKADFNNLFTNTIENNEEVSENKKIDKEKNAVFTNYEKKETKLNSYDLEVHIPQINISGEIVENYNKEIENIFLKMAQTVLNSENSNVVYTVDYIANVKDGILSLMIKSNFKEGTKAQKVIIQTYNYDLRNNKEITLEEILKIEGLNKEDVQSKVKTEISEETKKAQDLKSMGYNIYSRDENSNIYDIDNTTEFYLVGDTLYLIYAYGNQTETSEMDIVIL